MGFLDKAKDLLAQNADTVGSAIDKAGEFVDSKTDGKFKDTVNQVQEAAKNALKDGKRTTVEVNPWRSFLFPSMFHCRPEQAWADASNLSRYKEWLTIHRVWRSTLPEQLEKGTVIDSIVEVKGMPNRSAGRS